MLKGSQFISIGNYSRFADGLFLTAWKEFNNNTFTPSIQIGDYCHFGAFNSISCINNITIGNNLLTGKWVTINDNSHGSIDSNSLSTPPLDRPLVSKGKILIGNNVWIGDKVTILAGVSIGDGCVIGANSVVTKNIPSYCVVVGSPARIIRKINNL